MPSFEEPCFTILHCCVGWAAGLVITPQAAAAAGMRLPDRQLVAAARQGLADQLQSIHGDADEGDYATLQEGEEDSDEAEEEEEEEDEAVSRGGFAEMRSSSRAVLEEQRRRLKAEQQAVWRGRARTWRGQGAPASGCRGCDFALEASM